MYLFRQVATAGFTVILAASSLQAAPESTTGTVRERELKRMALNKQYDKLNLRRKTDFVTDSTDKYLVPPPEDKYEGEYTVAQVPPATKLRILPNLEPEYFTDLGDSKESYMLAWANWARITRSEDNRFFFAASDHRGQGCHINLYEYCPARNTLQRVVDIRELLGWTDHTLTDGKIHGHMGIMPDGTLWGATHYGVYPDSVWFANGYRGSWLFSYNINTHEAKNWGVPLVGNWLPCFNVDTVRGRLVGTGTRKTVLCWDTVEKKVRFAGYPPEGWVWWERAMFLDPATGKFWTTDNSDEKYRFMSFDPEFNQFTRYEISPPPSPYTGYVNVLRGYTDRPALDGWFYCCSKSERGNPGLAFFRFRPEGKNGPEVESLGVNWDKGRDTLQMVLSPKGRYVYYWPQGVTDPIIQYDVTTGKKKVLGWFHEYIFEKYGY
ncbi:MAG: hypothetical protein ACYC9O_14480, partial [Candidatus Latescibacterota bacterium]